LYIRQIAEATAGEIFDLAVMEVVVESIDSQVPAFCILGRRSDGHLRNSRCFRVGLTAQVYDINPNILNTDTSRLEMFRLVWIELRNPESMGFLACLSNKVVIHQFHELSTHHVIQGDINVV
jgi:hypothetical protein